MAKIRIIKSNEPSWEGYMFFCPGCKQHHMPNNSWQFNGDIDNPTLNPSILINGNEQYLNPSVPRCHSFVRDGKIQYLSDCTHELAGRTVDLPNLVPK